MTTKNSRAKPLTTSQVVSNNLVEKEKDFFPSLSNYDKPKELWIEGIPIILGIWGLTVKFWKLPRIHHAGFFFSNASIEAVIYWFLSQLTNIGLLTSTSKEILVYTLYTALVISCFVFLAKLTVEGIKSVGEKIKSAKKSLVQKDKTQDDSNIQK